MEKTKTPKQPKKKPMSTGPQHKFKRDERPLPTTPLTERAEILPATHIDDDPESFRIT